MNNCFGCKLSNKGEEVSVVYEDELITALLDIAPFNPGHVLIMSKKHYRYLDEFNQPTVHALTNATQIISKALKKLYTPDGITIIQNGGYCDELTHFHLHIIPRFKEQKFSEFFDVRGKYATRDELEAVKKQLITTLEELEK